MMWAISALRSSALLGMHPTLRQTPPQYFFSTTATFLPSWDARIAATFIYIDLPAAFGQERGEQGAGEAGTDDGEVTSAVHALLPRQESTSRTNRSTSACVL